MTSDQSASSSQLEEGSLVKEKQDVVHVLSEQDIDAAAEAHGFAHLSGRLVIDPLEAEREFGTEIASRLKKTADGSKILWPQPTDNAEDPQNWSSRKKNLTLFILACAAFVPDFDSGIGIAALFQLATQFNTTPTVINNQTSNWSIFLLSWGGLFAIPFGRKLGRLPVLFWSQFLGLAFLIGATVAPSLGTFTAMRCLTAFFSTAPQVTGLYIISDIFPFHLQARKTSIWGFGYLVSPFVSPALFGYLVTRATWRWAYGIGCIYGGIVVVMIVFLMEETAYDRHIHPVPARPTAGLRYRIETLIGITGFKMSRHRDSWLTCIVAPFRIVWRPQIFLLLLYNAVVFGFSVGLNVTTAQFAGMPRAAGGFGFSGDVISSLYFTPIVGAVLGEVLGRINNEKIFNLLTKRNRGIFVAEFRLWTFYVSLPLLVLGFCLYGYAISKRSYVALLIIGWGLYELGCVLAVVATLNYVQACFPHHAGETSAWTNMARVLGGFAIPYYQWPWAQKHGALKEAGFEAGIIAGLFLLTIPLLQWKGELFRQKFSLRSKTSGSGSSLLAKA